MKGRQVAVVILAAALWAERGSVVRAYPRDCSVICAATGSSCNDMCYVTEIDFENGNAATCLDYDEYDTCPPPPPTLTPGNGNAGSGKGSSCGNGTCDPNESCESCPQDRYNGGNNNGGQTCAPCGSGRCNDGDFGGYGSGNPPQCSLSVPSPWCTYCPGDCGYCQPLACWPQVCHEQVDGGHGECVACSSDSQCGAYSNAWCDPQTHTCETSCNTDSDCSGSAPYCDVNTGACVVCVSSVDCGASSPVCSSSHQCTGCSSDSDCGDYGSDYWCAWDGSCINECRDWQDCPEDEACVDGQCQVENGPSLEFCRAR
jgi:hypothetical protein